MRSPAQRFPTFIRALSPRLLLRFCRAPVLPGPSSISTGSTFATRPFAIWSMTYARWARRISLSNAREPRFQAQLCVRRSKRSNKAQTRAEQPKALKSCTLLRGKATPTKGDAPLTLSAARVVNPTHRKPGAWTWTRGGWLGRYPKIFAQAAREPARSNGNRIWIARGTHRCRGNRWHAYARRRRRRHVGQDQYGVPGPLESGEPRLAAVRKSPA